MTNVPLRLWPGVTAAVLLVLLRFVLPAALPETQVFGLESQVIGLIGWVFGALAILVWWVGFSRAPLSERLAAPAWMVFALLATSRLVHQSIAGAGMGMLLYILAIPITMLALVAWAAGGRRLSGAARHVSLAVTIVGACALFTLVRTGGVTSDLLGSEFHWRWTPTPEQLLLAQGGDAVEAPLPSSPEPLRAEPEATAAPSEVDDARPADPAAAETEPATPAAEAENAPVSIEPEDSRAEWPGFRGRGRDSVIRGVTIETDWTTSPPVALWRRPIGPGWSSFAVSGDLLYTQEQRGDDEIVAAYRVSTGEPVWRHRDAVRFWESNGGAGPRATPTLSGGRVYTFGATGIVNALNALTGSLVWSRDAAADTGRAVPDWGFASSPLVVNDVVIVAASGTLVAYEIATGKPRWIGPQHGGTYSSPQLVTIDGVVQVLLLRAPGATALSPDDGALLWEYSWEGGAIVQPGVTADGDVLINAQAMTGGMATRRIAVSHSSGGWRAEERWTSTGLKPYFNDFVVHEGHAFGFDGSILACIDLEDGRRTWKGGRYGNGQLVVLPDQDLLLVLSEDGELVLVSATPDKFTEIARIAAIDGKTWNHPAVIGDILLVRNGQEMAAFRLPLVRP